MTVGTRRILTALQVLDLRGIGGSPLPPNLAVLLCASAALIRSLIERADETAIAQVNDPPPNTGLLPKEESSDEYSADNGTVEGNRGPKSSAIRSLLAGACAG